MLVGCSGGPSSTVIAMSDSSSNRKEMVKLRWHLEKKKLKNYCYIKIYHIKCKELIDNKDRKVDLKEGKKRCKTVLAAK